VLYVNGTMVNAWQWSLTSQGDARMNQLGAMDDFGASLGDSNPFFYMDDVSYGVLQGKEVVEVAENPQFLYYNVYLNDFLLTETNNSTYQYEGLDLNSTYVGSASAMYSYMGDLHESAIIDVEFTFLQTDIASPTNLVATVANFNDVDLTWEFPVTGRFLETVLIFRDGDLVYETDGYATSYTEAVGAGTYEYYVQARYTGFYMSDPSNTATAEVVLPVPRNLTGETGGTIVSLQWEVPAVDFPGDEFYEDFEAGIPNDWTFVDADGDGYNWALATEFTAHSGTNCMYSASYDNTVGILNPDNYMITPQLFVGTYSELSFWYVAQDPSWPGDFVEVRVSTTDNSPASFTEVVGSVSAGSAYAQEVIDLSAFEGETVYIAFVHTNSSDLFYINVDDIEMTNATRVNAFEGYTMTASDKDQLRFSDMTQDEINEAVTQYNDGLVINLNNRALTGYNIYRDDELVGSTADLYYLDNVYVDDIYTYYVKADYSGYESDTSNNIQVSVITGVEELDANSISLYPNPAQNRVNITSSQEVTQISVFNYVGQLVYTSDLENETIITLNTTSYENGVYIIRLQSENGVITKRVVITQ